MKNYYVAISIILAIVSIWLILKKRKKKQAPSQAIDNLKMTSQIYVEKMSKAMGKSPEALFCQAARTNHSESLAMFMNYSSLNFNAKDENNTTALIYAAMNGNDDFLKILLGKGADPNIKGLGDVTAIILAAKNNHYDSVQILLDGGADIELCEVGGITPLLNAAYEGHNEIVKLLLLHNANINAQDSNGISALIISSKEGHVDVVETLLSNNANTNLKSQSGMTAIAWAESEGNYNIVELLKGQVVMGGQSKSEISPKEARQKIREICIEFKNELEGPCRLKYGIQNWFYEWLTAAPSTKRKLITHLCEPFLLHSLIEATDYIVELFLNDQKNYLDDTIMAIDVLGQLMLFLGYVQGSFHYFNFGLGIGEQNGWEIENHFSEATRVVATSVRGVDFAELGITIEESKMGLNELAEKCLFFNPVKINLGNLDKNYDKYVTR